MSKQKYIYIEWVDSVSTPYWGDPPKNTTMKCTTLGHFVTEDKVKICIALNYSLDSGASGYGHYIEIPKVAVTKRKWVRP